MTNNFKNKIIWKLLIWGLMIAIAGAVFSTLMGLERIDQRVASLAINEAVFYQRLYEPYYHQPNEMNRRKLVQALGERAPGGDFILIDIYNNEMHKIGKFALPGSRRIDRYFEKKGAMKPSNKLKYSKHYTNGKIYILLERPFLDATGSVIGYFEGLFQVPDKTTYDLMMSVVVNVLQTIAVIFGVALLLYPVTMALSRDLVKKSHDLMVANLDIINVLGSAIAKRDSDTNAHNYRVTLSAIALAEKIQLDRKRVQALVKGSFLHDVGKIGVSDNILLKPGKLDQDEFAEMKKHVLYGVDIIKSSHWLEDGSDVVRYHHEKFDGSGYPQGLVGEEIPVIARIFAIVDVFDALASKRPYKAPFPYAECIAILQQGSGTHFDPELINSFLEISEGLYRNLARIDEEGPLRKRLQQQILRYFEI